MRRRRSIGLPRTVWLLGFASFANDVSSEAIFPLLPLYLATLGGGVQLLGLIEGSADALASLVKVVAGRWADRGPRRLLVVGGYALPALARAGIAAALAPWHVLAARLTDRVGKGVRSGPRDALLADAVSKEETGRAFGVQRSLDHLGAAVGPLVASGLLFALSSLPQERALRITFAVAAVLGLVAPVLVLLRLEPRGRANASATATTSATATATETATATATATTSANANATANANAAAPLPAAFWRYLACATLFALANSSDAFLLRKAHDVGFSAAAVPLLWLGHHLVKALTGAPGGALSDRLPRAFVVAGGWLAYGLAYLGFSAATARWQVAALFGFYALYHGLTEAAERALVADAANRGARGRAYGWYHGVTGAAALPASVLTGWLWSTRGPAFALATSGSLALAAAALLTFSAWRGGRQAAA